jgi:hypothetical protein
MVYTRSPQHPPDTTPKGRRPRSIQEKLRMLRGPHDTQSASQKTT